MIVELLHVQRCMGGEQFYQTLFREVNAPEYNKKKENGRKNKKIKKEHINETEI